MTSPRCRRWVHEFDVFRSLGGTATHSTPPSSGAQSIGSSGMNSSSMKMSEDAFSQLLEHIGAHPGAVRAESVWAPCRLHMRARRFSCSSCGWWLWAPITIDDANWLRHEHDCTEGTSPGSSSSAIRRHATRRRSAAKALTNFEVRFDDPVDESGCATGL